MAIGNRQSAVRSAFTLIELLVVIVIIAILIGAVFAASTTVMARAKSRGTESVLSVVRDALEQFKREQKSNPTITRLDAYRNRYGDYPPDELEVFVAGAAKYPGATPWPPTFKGYGPGNATIVPMPNGPMKFYTVGAGAAPEKEHRDLAAMVLAIELYGQSSKDMLDQLPPKNRSPGPLDGSTPPKPAQFLDRDGGGWSDAGQDVQIRYILDDWGMPLGYFAQRDFKEATKAVTVSTNDPDWNEASTEFVRLNGGQPVIFSYGPNGPDQLTAEMLTANPASSLVGDFEEPESSPGHHKVDQPVNEDNLYADPTLKQKLARGLQ